VKIAGGGEQLQPGQLPSDVKRSAGPHHPVCDAPRNHARSGFRHHLRDLDPDRAGGGGGHTISGAASVLKSYNSFINDRSYRTCTPTISSPGIAARGSSSIGLYLGVQGPVMTIAPAALRASDAIGLRREDGAERELDVVIAGGRMS